MVRIRYAELPVGLHVAMRSYGHRTVVYLLHGLTPEQRKAALTFAKRSARIGQGPRLPAGDMALALVADRFRTTARAVSAATRKHPLLLLPPLVVTVSTVIVFVLLTLVAVNPRPAGTGSDERPAGSSLVPAGAGGRVAGAGQPDRPAGVTPNPASGTPSVPVPESTPAGLGSPASGQPSPGLQKIPPQLCYWYRQFGACSSS
jgi:hypothetical protein